MVKRDESSGLNLGFSNASRIMTCLRSTYISPTMCHLQTRVFLSEKLSTLTTDNQDFSVLPSPGLKTSQAGSSLMCGGCVRVKKEKKTTCFVESHVTDPL